MAQKSASLALESWRRAAVSQAALRCAEAQVDRLGRGHAARSLLRTWRQATGRVQKLQALAAQKDNAAVRQAFYAWHTACRARALLRSLEDAAATAAVLSLQRRVLAALQSHAASVRLVELPNSHPVMLAAASHRHRRTLGRSFASWRTCSEQGALSRESVRLLLTAERQARSVQCSFAAWRSAARAQRAEREEERQGFAARTVLLSRKALDGWRKHCRWAAASSAATTQFQLLHRRQELRRAMDAWTSWHSHLVQIRAEQAAKTLHTLLTAWQAGVAWQVAEEKANAKAHAADTQTLRAALWGWQDATKQAKQLSWRARRSQTVLGKRRLLMAFASWRHGTLTARIADLTTQIADLAMAQQSALLASAEHEARAVELDHARVVAERCVGEQRNNLQAMTLALQAAKDMAAEHQAAMEAAHLKCAEAEERRVEALRAANGIVQAEQQARCTAEAAACWAESLREAAVAAAQADRDAAVSAALAAATEASAEAAAATERCHAAEERAARAEDAAAAAAEELQRMSEREQAANSACVRLAEDVRQLQEATDDATARLDRAVHEIQALQAARAGLQREVRGLKEELGSEERLRHAAEAAKEVAEADARAALRQAQRLADMVEQHIADRYRSGGGLPWPSL